jgi:hypothetical protein
MQRIVMSAPPRPAPRFWITFASQIIAIPIVFACAQALAEPVTFGARTFNMPAPEGFVAVSKSAPRYVQLSQGYLPASNRLVEAFVPAEAAQALAENRGASFERYFQLQTLRKADGRPLSSEDFRNTTTEIEAQFAKVLKEVDVDKLTREGNAQVKKSTTTDPQVAISGIESQGVYRREPWGIFFTVRSRVASGVSGEPTDLICAAGLTLINHQLMYLNGYAQQHGPADERWVQQAVSSWADMVHAANPDDAAVAAQAESLSRGGFNWKQLRDRTLLGAGIGALFGLVIALARKGRR